MCIGTALANAQKTNGTATTIAGLSGASGDSTTGGQTAGSGTGQDATSTSALTSITAPDVAVIGGFSTGQASVQRGGLVHWWQLCCEQAAACLEAACLWLPPPAALTMALATSTCPFARPTPAAALQGTGPDGTPTAGTSSTELQASTPNHSAYGSLQAGATSQGGPSTADTTGLATADTQHAQVCRRAGGAS